MLNKFDKLYKRIMMQCKDIHTEGRRFSNNFVYGKRVLARMDIIEGKLWIPSDILIDGNVDVNKPIFIGGTWSPQLFPQIDHLCPVSNNHSPYTQPVQPNTDGTLTIQFFNINDPQEMEDAQINAEDRFYAVICKDKNGLVIFITKNKVI